MYYIKSLLVLRTARVYFNAAKYCEVTEFEDLL
jgi:hypothetical protein